MKKVTELMCREKAQFLFPVTTLHQLYVKVYFHKKDLI